MFRPPNPDGRPPPVTSDTSPPPAPRLVRGLCRVLAWAVYAALVAQAPAAYAQDVEDVYGRTRDRLTDRPVRLAGGVDVTGTAAYFSGAQPRYDRYGFRAGANLNFDVLGVSAPFSLYYSDKNLLYRLPSYSFAGISPSYRWARFHLGDRNLNFSPYTYSDQTFRGVGVELTPGRGGRADAMIEGWASTMRSGVR